MTTVSRLRRRLVSPALGGLVTRDAVAVASPVPGLRDELYGEPTRPLPSLADEVSPFRDWRQDARLFAPASVVRPTRPLVGLRPGGVVGGRSLASLTFGSPLNVLICARRRARREVLHARRVAGGRVRRSVVRSSVRCVSWIR